MGEAKKRGTIEERKAQAIAQRKREENQQKYLEEKLLAFAKRKLEKPKPRLSQFTDSITNSLATKNYFAALIMALTLPDICCSLEDEQRRTNVTKYAAWFTKYVGHNYVHALGGSPDETIFLTGEECYALRCTYLHKGFNQIEDEKAVRDYIDSAKRIEFMAEMSSDCLKVNGVLLLKLENFCQYIIQGVNQWLTENTKNSTINRRMLEIPEIFTEGFSPSPGVFIGG
ncbi:MAG: hypothetical protein RSD40_04390 [Bacilli bacterium]